MNQLKWFVFGLLFSPSTTLFSQDTSRYYIDYWFYEGDTFYMVYDKQYFLHEHTFKVDAVPVFDWVNTSLRISYEQRLGKKSSIQIGTGICYNLWNIGKYDYSPAQEVGGLANLEIRRYFHWPTVSGAYEPFYVGLRGSYYYHDMTKKMGFIHHDSMDFKSPTSRHYFRQEKEVWGLFLTMGGVFVNSPTATEVHLGIGSIYRRVDNFTQDSWGRPFFPHAYRWAVMMGDGKRWWTPAFYVAVKLGLGWDSKKSN